MTKDEIKTKLAALKKLTVGAAVDDINAWIAEMRNTSYNLGYDDGINGRPSRVTPTTTPIQGPPTT
jgi:hypothetical protein